MLETNGLLFPSTNPPHFDPHCKPMKPTFTTQEEHMRMVQIVHETLDRVLALENSVRTTVESYLQKVGTDNATFKDLTTSTYNEFANAVQNEVNSFETTLLQAYETFKNSVNVSYTDFQQKYEDFTVEVDNIVDNLESKMFEAMNAHFASQDLKIAESEQYFKSNFFNTVKTAINEMKTNGTFASLLATTVADKMITNEKFAETVGTLATKTELDVERQRINNIVALPNGSTTGDAELADLRVGANGETYTTAGAAVREQFTEMNETKLGIDKVVGNIGYKSDRVISQEGVTNALNELGTQATNAIRKTVTGAATKIDDASEISHNLSISPKVKNLIPVPYIGVSEEKNGLSFTVNDDFSISVSGTATADTWFDLCVKDFGTGALSVPNGKLTNGEYAISGHYVEYNPTNKRTAICIRETETVNVVIFPQIERGTVATAFEKPVDIVNQSVRVCGKNLLAYPYISSTGIYNGVEIIDNGDGTITANGTCNKTFWFNLNHGFISNQGANGETGGYNTHPYIKATDCTYNPANYIASIQFKEGQTYNRTYTPMLEIGDKVTEWEAYVNGNMEETLENLLPFPYVDGSKNLNGLTFTVNNDGSITVAGTATAETYFNICEMELGETSFNAFTDNANYRLHGQYLAYNATNKKLALRFNTGTTVDQTIKPALYRNPFLCDTFHFGSSESVLAKKPTGATVSILPSVEGMNMEIAYNQDTTTAITETVNNALKSIDIDLDKFSVVDFEKYGLPIVYFEGDTTGMTKDNEVALSYRFGERTGGCTLKWQGNSSLSYPKKNYTVKFDEKFEAVEGWGEQKKYCLKANYIDFTHSRNVVCAKLWGQIVKNRATANEKLLATPNGGAVDGFPVCVVINGEYQGLYTFNIPKDKWQFGMGDGEKEALITAENHTYSTRFKADIALDGSDFEVEYATDENDTAWIKDSVNEIISRLIETDGSDIDELREKFDFESAIDYMIFTSLVQGVDMVTKNYILGTYNGGENWFISAYDMDSTFGLYWDGKSLMGANSQILLKNLRDNHQLMNVICKYMKDDLKSRYTELRNSILSEDNVATLFGNFIGTIPKALFDEEVRLWNDLRSTAVVGYAQILDWYRRRVAVIDKEIDTL